MILGSRPYFAASSFARRRDMGGMIVFQDRDGDVGCLEMVD